MPSFPDFDNTAPSAINDGFLKTLPYCKLATIGNADIQGLNAGDSIDGVFIAEGDKIAIRAQTDATENGVYVMGGQGLERPDYLDSLADFGNGVIIPITHGATYAGKAFKVLPPAGPLGSADVVFSDYENWLATESKTVSGAAFDNGAPGSKTVSGAAFDNGAPGSKTIAGATFDNSAPGSKTVPGATFDNTAPESI